MNDALRSRLGSRCRLGSRSGLRLTSRLSSSISSSNQSSLCSLCSAISCCELGFTRSASKLCGLSGLSSVSPNEGVQATISSNSNRRRKHRPRIDRNYKSRRREAAKRLRSRRGISIKVRRQQLDLKLGRTSMPDVHNLQEEAGPAVNDGEGPIVDEPVNMAYGAHTVIGRKT